MLMKKWILLGAGAIVLIIVIVVVVGLSNLGPIIKSAVNTYGPRITKTEVRVGDVGISIFSGEAKLKDFLLGNPKGFRSAQAMRVGSIYVGVNERSLAGDTIIIEKIEVVRPEITYEKSGGTDNFTAILSNVKASAGEAKASKAGSAGEGQGRKLLIRNLVVREGKVNLAISTPVIGKTIRASLPDLHLKDLGSGKGGASPAEVFEAVLAALHKQITSQAVADMLNKELKAFGTSLDAVGGTAKQLESLGKGDVKGAGKVGDTIKGLLGK
jgi:uncharacterized protein involved in outer membrane biogenesis